MNDKRYPFRRSFWWHFVQWLDFILDRFKARIRRQRFPDAVQNILVVRLDQIGDVVCSLPALPYLKRRFPEAKLTLLVGEEGKVILEGNPFVDRILVFRSNWFSRERFVNPIELFRILFALRKLRFDLGFDLRGDIRNIVLMTLGGVRYRIGYGIAGGGGLLHELRDYDPLLHQVELNLKLVTDQRIERAKLKPEIYLAREEKEAAAHSLKELGAQEHMRLIAIHPEAGYTSKEWERGKFEGFVKQLLVDLENQILILGLSKARELAEHFASSGRVINLVGTCSLRQAIAILSHCQLFIGNDSGPSHLAQALGIPTVVIASGTNEYDKWGVWIQPSRILKHEVPCSPCHLRVCNVEGHPCMSRISPAQVLEAVNQLLSDGARCNLS